MKPSVLLPIHFDTHEGNAKQVLLHESTHIKYWHAFIKMQRESYALNLLKASQMQNEDSVVYSDFAKDSIKERIVAIMNFKMMSVFALVVSLSIPVSVASAFATTDNLVDGKIVEEVAVDFQKDNTSQSSLNAYVDQSQVLRAAKRLYMYDFEYISDSMPPEKINISFKDRGYAYKGTLTMFELQINGKYYAYYEGWTSRV